MNNPIVARVLTFLGPVNVSDPKQVAIFAAGFFAGSYLLSPYLGATDVIPMALVGWATGRAVCRVSWMYNVGRTSDGILPAVIPLGVMYLVAGAYPMVDIQSSLLVYASYVASGVAAESYLIQ